MNKVLAKLIDFEGDYLRVCQTAEYDRLTFVSREDATNALVAVLLTRPQVEELRDVLNKWLETPACDPLQTKLPV